MKCLIICSATSRSAITPLRSGRTVRMLAGVLPSISLASSPTARTLGGPLPYSSATTDGSWMTTPAVAQIDDRVAVPRSIARSRGPEIEKREIHRPPPGEKSWPDKGLMAARNASSSACRAIRRLGDNGLIVSACDFLCPTARRAWQCWRRCFSIVEEIDSKNVKPRKVARHGTVSRDYCDLRDA